MVASATGTMRTTVRLRTAYSRVVQPAWSSRTGTAIAPKTSQTSSADQRAGLLGEGQLGGAAPAGRRAEGQAAAERGHEAVPLQRREPPRTRRRPGRGRRCRRSSSAAHPRLRASRSSRPPTAPTAPPTAAPISELQQRGSRAGRVREPLCGDRTGQRDEDDRGDDAVVEAALHGDQPADAGGHRRVRHHRERPARRRSEPAPHPRASASQPPSPGSNQAASTHPASTVSGRPTASSRTHRPASARRSCSGHACGVGEQHPHEGGLDQGQDGLGLGGSADQSGLDQQERRPA